MSKYSLVTVLYWVGTIYHGPTFRRALDDAYGNSDVLDLQKLDWRWNGLLFAILCSSMIGSSEHVSSSWGFCVEDKVRFSRLWGAACIACLNLGNFIAQYHISSIQAIYILHSYEHLVGSTNQWVALRSFAVVIAKGLGLHELVAHPNDSRFGELCPEKKQAFVEREIGRRVWYCITSQEWLCAASQSTYTILIQKHHYNSARPLELDEETMLLASDSEKPAPLCVLGFHYDYATQLLDFQNMMEATKHQDEHEKYAVILKFDGDMRVACDQTIPNCLSPHVPLNPQWPRWVAWARRLRQACIHHKYIVIHQNYLNKSFTDARYTYTRWVCATSAKNIIRLYHGREPDEPQWWVEQAFVVVAGICLILDLFHRVETDHEVQEYLPYVQKAITYLQQFCTSSVAVHGARLLVSLLHEYTKLRQGAKEVPTTSSTGPYSDSSAVASAQSYVAEPVLPDTEAPDQTLVVYPDMTASAVFNEDAAQFNFDVDTTGFEELMDYMSPENIINSQVLFDSVTSIMHRQSSW